MADISNKRSRHETGEIIVQRKQSFSVIPDHILENTELRTETRLILGWIIGRPPRWKIQVWYVQFKLGITPKRWARARKELEAAGYLVQRRARDQEGKYLWTHHITDDPIANPLSIPPKRTDGDARDGQSRNGKSQGITKPTHHSKNKQSNKTTFAVSQACITEARDLFPGYDIEGLERQWLAWVGSLAEKPRYPDKAFLGWLKKYCDRNPLCQSDRTRYGLEERAE